MNEISSAQNPKYRRWLSLLESKGIKKEGVALVSGEKLVREWMAFKPESIEDILLPPKGDYGFDHSAKPYRLTSPLFKELDVIGTHSPIAVVKTPAIPAWYPADSPRGLELIVAMSDPSNLGAILRSAEAFGVHRVILTQESASPFLPKALKSSSLSSLRVPLVKAGPLAAINVPSLHALDMDGERLDRYAWPENLYLLIGQEGEGVPSDLIAKRLSIPMSENVESLNATVAGAIAMFAYQSRN